MDGGRGLEQFKPQADDVEQRQQGDVARAFRPLATSAAWMARAPTNSRS
jgi:hypothetical protein